MEFFVYIIVAFLFGLALSQLTKRDWLGGLAWLILVGLGLVFIAGVKILTMALILVLYISATLLYRYYVVRKRRKEQLPDPTPGNADEFIKQIEKEKETK